MPRTTRLVVFGFLIGWIVGTAIGCGSVRSPIAKSPEFQTPFAAAPAQAPKEAKAPCETKPVYKAVAPHIDKGPKVCMPGDPECDPYACPAMDPINGPSLPGYDKLPELEAANEQNARQPEPGVCAGDECSPPNFFCTTAGLCVVVAVLLAACFCAWLIFR